MKHPEAPNHVKPPTTPLYNNLLFSIIFKNDLPIEQAMINLYEQIKMKGLYFFCPFLKKNEVKYHFLKPGPTIKSIYDKFGKSGYLTIVYSDSQLGMQGMLTL